MVHAARKDQHGGGVAIVHRDWLKVSKQTVNVYDTFEHMEVLLQTGSDCVRLCVVYRPPSSSKPQFLDDFNKYIDELATMSGKLLVLGDFNIHIDKPADSDAQTLRDLMYCLNLEQHVSQATHEKGHILDVITSLSVIPAAFSDHYILKFNIPGKKFEKERKTIKIRNIKKLNLTKLRDDIENSKLVTDPLLQHYPHCHS